MTEVDGRAVFSQPKDYERRTVPYPSFLDELMVPAVTGRDPAVFLFPSPKGEVLRYRNMHRAWWDVVAEDVGLAGLTPHELRHTAASLAVRSGASVLVPQRMLGHASPRSPWTSTRTCSTTTWTPCRTRSRRPGRRLSRRPPRRVRQVEGRGDDDPRMKPPLTCAFACAPETIRTSDTRFRRAVLYPLSYEGPSARRRGRSEAWDSLHRQQEGSGTTSGPSPTPPTMPPARPTRQRRSQRDAGSGALSR